MGASSRGVLRTVLGTQWAQYKLPFVIYHWVWLLLHCPEKQVAVAYLPVSDVPASSCSSCGLQLQEHFVAGVAELEPGMLSEAASPGHVHCRGPAAPGLPCLPSPRTEVPSPAASSLPRAAGSGGPGGPREGCEDPGQQP